LYLPWLWAPQGEVLLQSGAAICTSLQRAGFVLLDEDAASGFEGWARLSGGAVVCGLQKGVACGAQLGEQLALNVKPHGVGLAL
jgi:hypothetical protein